MPLAVGKVRPCEPFCHHDAYKYPLALEAEKGSPIPLPARCLQARKQYKVFYPALYADKAHNKDADAFNCVQRGHQNTLENFPPVLGLLLATGLRVSHVVVDKTHVLLFLYCVSTAWQYKDWTVALLLSSNIALA